MMKIALGFAAMILLASVPAQAQRAGAALTHGSGGGSSSGGPMSGTTSFSTLGWNPPTTLATTNVSGSDATYLPSTFVTFANAVAQGNTELKGQSRSIVEVAAEARKAAKPVRIQFVQDDRGNVVPTAN